MEHIRTEAYQKGQEFVISELIRRVYDEFVSGDYSEEGNRFFYDWIQPGRIAERQSHNRSIRTAFVGMKMVGVIEIRDNNRISLLFVEKDYQGLGIAKLLFEESLAACKKRDAGLDKFFVHSSPFAIPVYEKLGFTAAGSMQEEHGIRYLPMEMKIEPSVK
jgi:GNAT superfamily N-acetyltransferase